VTLQFKSQPSCSFLFVVYFLLVSVPQIMALDRQSNYRIFSNLIFTLFTVSEGIRIACGLDSWSWAGFWKNGRDFIYYL